METASNNKRIAKNTLMLYIRMLLLMAVSLYTSRIVINTLGISDYGLYNVVGGIVVMLSFLNSSMSAASQRFISFELGKGNLRALKQVFYTSLVAHFTIAGILLVFAETVGLWFLNNYINIDAARFDAANWVYQCSIFSFMVSIISVPFNACIIAHEHMKAYTYISIFEVIFKLVIVYFLILIPSDKLIVYALLLLGVSLLTQFFYIFYCKRHFEECSFGSDFNFKLFRHMLSFVSWNVLGTSSFTFKDQGVNIIINLFFNTTVNAARGVAMQVNGVVTNFTNNFLMALRPQITKQYAEGNVIGSASLVYSGCKYSAYLVLIIGIPLMINMDYLLFLWLGEVPEHTSAFLCIILISTLFRTIQLPLITAIHATGKIRFSQLMISLVNFTEIPLAYLILALGGEPYMSMIPTIIVALVGIIVYLVCLRKLVSHYEISCFVRQVMCRVLLIAIIGYCFSLYIHSCFSKENILTCFSSCCTSVFIVGSTIYFIGISEKERYIVKKQISGLARKFMQ